MSEPDGDVVEPVSPLEQLERDSDEWLAELREAARPRLGGRLGRFEILGEIAQGGQGHVFRVRQPETGREIALKRLAAGTFASSAARRRFEREVELLASLRHEGIVTVFGVDSVGEQTVLTMEWVEGRSLTEWARDVPPGKKGVRTKLELFLQVCEAVQFAHANGVLHRDLKPSNILVDVRGRCRLVDFGLARRLDAQTTNTLGFLGTPAYAPPESFTEERAPLDVRADVYSLGVVLYECLTGRRPFRATRLAELVVEIEQGRPARPSSLEPVLGEELDAVVLQALATSARERYATVHALGEDLRRYLAGRPVQAVSPSVGYLVRKWIGRNRLTAAVSSALLLTILASAVIGVRQSRRIRDERNAALAAQARAEEAAAKATLLQNFYIDAVADSVSPSDAAPSRSVATVIAWCSDHLDERLGAYPDLATEACRMLVVAWNGLKEFERSAEVARRGIALVDARVVPAPVLRAGFSSSLANALLETGRLAQALDAAGDGLRAIDGLDSPEALPIRIDLLLSCGEGAARSGQQDEAMRCLHEANRLGREHGEPALSATASEVLVNELMKSGKWAEAETLLNDVVAGRDPEHPDTVMATAMGQLAVLCWQRLRNEEAVTHCELAVSDLHRIGNPDVLRIWLGHLGRIQVSAGNLPRALEVFEELLSIEPASSSETDRSPLVARLGRARCKLFLGDAQEAARAYLEDGLPALEQASWYPEKDRLEARLCALSACVAAERLEEAESLYRELAEQLRAAATRTVFPDPALLERVRADVPKIGYEEEYEALLAELIARAADSPRHRERMAALAR